MKIQRRGFKKEAHDYARELRDELKLKDYDPLCPWKLATHLQIPVVPISQLKPLAPKEIEFLMSEGQNEFFGVTISFGLKRVVLHNDASALTRQRSDIAHELSHAILAHPPSPPFNAKGERSLDTEIEKEATWLGGALLVSEEATLRVVREKLSIERAAKLYGVSPKLMRMRLNFTGAQRRVARKF